MMATHGRVHPQCVNASNPYHECGVACLEKIPQGEGKKLDKKKLGISFSSARLSFGRKKKGTDSQTLSPLVSGGHQSPRSPFSNGKITVSDSSQSFSSSQQHSHQSDSRDHSLEKESLQSSLLAPMSGNITPDRPKSPANGSFTNFGKNATTKKAEVGGNLNATPRGSTRAIVDLSFLGLSNSPEDSDEEEEVQSVVSSDSFMSATKYNMSESLAPILQSITNKYGDIAANCQLESASMRSHYLECLCSIIQKLKSAPFKELTKSKIKEMGAVIKDAESVQINVSWLHETFNKLNEAIELNSQQQVAEAEKASNDHKIQSLRKELYIMIEDLAEKEKEVANTKARILETQARLSELELQSSKLGGTISSIQAKIHRYESETLVEDII